MEKTTKEASEKIFEETLEGIFDKVNTNTALNRALTKVSAHDHALQALVDVVDTEEEEDHIDKDTWHWLL